MSINYITTYGLCLDILFFPLHSCTLILSQNLFHSTQIHSPKTITRLVIFYFFKKSLHYIFQYGIVFLVHGALVKWLRLRPLTAASRVRIPYASPIDNSGWNMVPAFLFYIPFSCNLTAPIQSHNKSLSDTFLLS